MFAELEPAGLGAIVEDRAGIGAGETDGPLDDGLEHDLRSNVERFIHRARRSLLSYSSTLQLL